MLSSADPEPKKQSAKQREFSNLTKELKIRKTEQKLLDEEREPENDDDFERLILKKPNDSFVWINYVAFKMEKEGI